MKGLETGWAWGQACRWVRRKPLKTDYLACRKRECYFIIFFIILIKSISSTSYSIVILTGYSACRETRGLFYNIIYRYFKYILFFLRTYIKTKQKKTSKYFKIVGSRIDNLEFHLFCIIGILNVYLLFDVNSSF